MEPILPKENPKFQGLGCQSLEEDTPNIQLPHEDDACTFMKLRHIRNIIMRLIGMNINGILGNF